MNDLITVDPKKIQITSEEGGKFFFRKEAEEQIIKLFELKDLIDQAIKQMKEQIKDNGLAIDEGFKGVLGEKVRATFKTYGEKYTFKAALIEELKPFLKEKTIYKVDSKAVDNYAKEHKKYPDGIVEKPRTQSLTITLK